MTSNIRKAKRQDHPLLLDIWLAASRAGHAFLGEQVLQEQLPIIRDVYLHKAENWVAMEEGRVLGFIGLIGNHIGGLFVSPDRHRRGVGKLLIEHASSRLGDLTVEVYERNTSATAFYARCGFRLIDRKDLDDEGRPLPLLRMERLGNIRSNVLLSRT